MNRKKGTLIIVNIFLPLVVGSLVYYFYKRAIVISAPIRNFTPDFLWFYSFTFSILILREFNLLNKITVVIYLSSPLIFELFQKSGLIPGTFDLYDIIAYYSGGIIAFLIFQVFYSNRLTTNKL
jgi:hypothetical protein